VWVSDTMRWTVEEKQCESCTRVCESNECVRWRENLWVWVRAWVWVGVRVKECA
jgi:hypothetical protein